MREQAEMHLRTRAEIPDGWDALSQLTEILGEYTGEAAPSSARRESGSPRCAENVFDLDAMIETVRREASVQPVRFRKILRNLSEEEREKLAAAADRETDEAARLRLYRLFSQTDYPHDPAPLIMYARQYEALLADAEGCVRREYLCAVHLMQALERLRHPAVRAYGMELYARGGRLRRSALALWAANYKPSDRTAFADAVREFPVVREGDQDWHSAQITALELIRKNPAGAPTELLMHIYETSLCGHCRGRAAEELTERGMLSAQLREECLHDSESSVRTAAVSCRIF